MTAAAFPVTQQDLVGGGRGRNSASPDNWKFLAGTCTRTLASGPDVPTFFFFFLQEKGCTAAKGARSGVYLHPGPVCSVMWRLSLRSPLAQRRWGAGSPGGTPSPPRGRVLGELQAPKPGTGPLGVALPGGDSALCVCVRGVPSAGRCEAQPGSSPRRAASGRAASPRRPLQPLRGPGRPLVRAAAAPCRPERARAALGVGG